MPGLIQDYFTFGELKINCSPAAAPLSDYGRQISHIPEHRDKFFISGTFLRVFLFKNFCNTCVGHPAVHTDNAFSYAVIHHFSFMVYRHKAAQSKAVLSFIQRTDTIGQCMREHGDYPVHKIHAGASF